MGSERHAPGAAVVGEGADVVEELVLLHHGDRQLPLVKHVHLRLPGMAGSTAQLRFEFAQDAIATCADVRPGHTCGVAVDNIVVRSVRSTAP